MKLILGVILVISHFGDIPGLILNGDSQNLEAIKSYCDALCRTSLGRFGTDPREKKCRCPDIKGFQQGLIDNNVNQRLAKRATFQDVVKKINGNNKTPRKNLIFSPTQRPKKVTFKKKLANDFRLKPKAAEQPAMYQEFKDRFKALKTKMLGKPQMRARANFNEDEAPNLIEQLKSKQAEFKEKLRQAANSKPLAKTGPATDDSKTQSDKLGPIHANLARSHNVETSTVEPSKISHIPVIVLMPSSTTPMPESMKRSDGSDTNLNKNEKVASAIEKIKERQKDAVTKIKGKILVSKIKPKDKEEMGENEKVS